MVLWEILAICGIIFILLEIFTPTMFFLNFAVASFVTAIVSILTTSVPVLVLTFFILSFLSFVFLRPLLLQGRNKDDNTGVEDKYIGRTAKVVEDVSKTAGAIKIYDEKWNARCEDDSVILAGSEVIIVKNDTLMMYVKAKS